MKIDCALQPSSAAAAVTSEYVKMYNYDKAIFIIEAGSGLTASGTWSASVVSAYSNTGGGSAALSFYTTMPTSTPIDALTINKASAILVDAISSANTLDTLTINDLIFTFNSSAGVTTGTFSTNRYVTANDDGSTANVTAPHLAACINHASYGVPGVTAVVNGSVIATASSNNVLLFTGGETAITAIASAVRIALVPVKSVAQLEVKSADLLANTSHKYVAVTLTPSSVPAAGGISATIVRSGWRYAYSNTGYVSDYNLGTT